MNKFLYLLSIFIFCTASVFSQSRKESPKYTVPNEYNFLTEEDYLEYEPAILETIDWYLWNSLAFDSRRRQDANTFFVSWLTGTPTVSVILDTNILPFDVDKSPDLLIPFMMGQTKYAIDNDASENKIKCCIAGIRTAIKFYDDNKFFFKEDKLIDKYRKMSDKKLEKYLKKQKSLENKLPK